MKSHAMFRFLPTGRVVECQVTDPDPAGKGVDVHNEFHLLGTPSASPWMKEGISPEAKMTSDGIFLILPLKVQSLLPLPLGCSLGSQWWDRLFLKDHQGRGHAGDVTARCLPGSQEGGAVIPGSPSKEGS